MLSEQNDTFISREGIYKFSGEEEKKVHAMSVDQIAQYVLRTLAVPMGNIVRPSYFQTYTYACLNETSSNHNSDAGSGHVSLASHAQHTVNPAVNKCVSERGHECPLKFVGSTIDPIGTGLDKYGDEVYRRVVKAYPDLPVIIYRRSNLVKHAMARGGICGKDMAKLNQHQNVSEFMSKVMEAVEHDNALMHAASFFPNKKIVTYEDLQNRPFDTMNEVLRFLRMPGKVTPEMVGRGVQETPEDLRKLFSNFGELDRVLSARSPCLAEQLRVTTPKAFYKPCIVPPAAPATSEAHSSGIPVTMPKASSSFATPAF
jgi:hypothetical protein